MDIQYTNANGRTLAINLTGITKHFIYSDRTYYKTSQKKHLLYRSTFCRFCFRETRRIKLILRNVSSLTVGNFHPDTESMCSCWNICDAFSDSSANLLVGVAFCFCCNKLVVVAAQVQFVYRSYVFIQLLLFAWEKKCCRHLASCSKTFFH